MNNLSNTFKTKKGIITLICGIICVGILFFAYRYRVNKKVAPVTVPYATKILEPRKLITEEDISSVKVAKSMITENVIKSEKEVVGKYVNYNTTIPKGSLFYNSQVVEWKSMPDASWSNIENGNTVFSLSISGLVMFSNSIYPGAIIDLYYQTYDDGKLVYGKLIENIKVLAVKDENGQHVFEKSANQTNASAIIFSVPEELHLLLRKASYLSGSIIPVLRNANYTNEETNKNKTLVSSQYLKELILEQTIDVPLDVIENNDDDNLEVVPVDDNKKEEEKKSEDKKGILDGIFN